ncbi:FAD-binding oxidoreductase [Brevibacillus humidisoli]|uniref:FAD-binding oxidoreductase n=1 Tax=Brevibacillus humidisoli TaxID=2895522 RepID=UPI001E5FECA0|nr:FAD-binding oxidoreductase [Brevibacillus humidisoli]UFJ42705.1 FAD-binding oxidoreductase [Brevibacillus humidisoli]
MLITELADLIPDLPVTRHPQPADTLGNTAAYTVCPQTEQEIATVLSYANKHSLTVIPQGGGSKRGFGGLVEQADLILSLSRMTGITEHSVGDMTVTVRAGTTMDQLNEYLSQYGQMVPLDPFWPQYATIGGVIAANDSGPKRCRYGSARDWVIGLRLVYPDGRMIRAGGKVVKNVAGYDMNKLFIGSMGTLGVISELTLKLRPLPQQESLMVIGFPPDQPEHARSFVLSLLDSPLEPTSLEWLSPAVMMRLSNRVGPGLAVAFEDVASSVAYQEKWVIDHLPQAADCERLTGEEARSWWRCLAQLPPIAQDHQSHDPEKTRISLKIGSKNMDVLTIVDQCQRLAEAIGLDVEAHGGLAHGITRVHAIGEKQQLSSYVAQTRSVVEQRGGYAILQHAPLEMRQQLLVWGAEPAYFPVLKRLKEAIDPKGTLNAKRFVGGM